MTPRRPHLWFCLLLALPCTAAAETGFIIDRVEVGLYESASTDSPILKLLPTGTELEILEHQDNLARVREPGGDIGWIDTRYLMGEKPTRQLLNEAEAELVRLRSELEAARQQLITRPAEPAADMEDEVERLKQIRDNLQSQLAAERERISDFKGELMELRAQLEDARTDPDVAGEQDSLDRLRYAAGDRSFWITLGLIFLIGLALGIFLLDYLNRRRHGGFRI